MPSTHPADREPTLRCEEVMRRRVVVVAAESSVSEAARLMHENGCGILPVVDADGRVVGVLTDRDIVIRACARGEPHEGMQVEAIMTRELVSCTPADLLHTAEEHMMAQRKERILVMDRGELVGILSLSDIAQVEQPLRLARLVREISARQIRMERN